jgi:hypothetical protein
MSKNTMQEIIVTLANELQKEIDKQVIDELKCLMLGWTPVEISNIYKFYALEDWCEKNCTGEYKIFSKIYFAEPKDAMWFRLTWT